MTARTMVTGDSRPALPRHVRLRHDEQRGRWVILAPERVLLPDEISVEILHLCDGKATVDDIASALAQDYSAPEDEIRADVIDVLQNLIDKGFLSA